MLPKGTISGLVVRAGPIFRDLGGHPSIPIVAPRSGRGAAAGAPYERYFTVGERARLAALIEDVRWRRVPWLSAVLVVCVGCGAGTVTTRAVRHFAATRADRVLAVRATSSAGQPVDPSAFSAGACVAFSPTASARHLTVFLDAGHGGRDPGAVGVTESGRTIYEADETLAVHLDTMAILRAAGFGVVVSRTRDSSVLRLGSGDVLGQVLLSHHAKPVTPVRWLLCDASGSRRSGGRQCRARSNPGAGSAPQGVLLSCQTRLLISKIQANRVLAELRLVGKRLATSAVARVAKQRSGAGPIVE